MTKTNTPQLDFWRGSFGDSYTGRNAASPEHIRARVKLWAEILSYTISAPPSSILEVGANIGNNLRALKILTGARMYALEPNDSARNVLVGDHIVDEADLLEGDASSIDLPDGVADLSFTSGVLIHIAPDHLLKSMCEIHRCSRQWVACVEYFSDKPEMIPYRGQDDRLFKRDFGSYWLENFHDLRIVAYGFAWKTVTGLDNLTWWLMEKR